MRFEETVIVMMKYKIDNSITDMQGIVNHKRRNIFLKSNLNQLSLLNNDVLLIKLRLLSYLSSGTMSLYYTIHFSFYGVSVFNEFSRQNALIFPF